MTLMMISLFMTMMFMIMTHPMTLGMNLLIQTISISMIIGFLNSTYWFSYILFLIMIGGLLILFIYMTSIASNEMFFYSNKLIMIMTTTFIIMQSFTFIFDKFFIYYKYTYMENILMMKNNLTMIKFMNYPSMIIIFFMIIYLFITLIAIVKITKFENGPLRQKL